MFADARAHKARIAYPAASLPRVQLPTLNDVVRVCCFPLPHLLPSRPIQPASPSPPYGCTSESARTANRAPALARGHGGSRTPDAPPRAERAPCLENIETTPVLKKYKPTSYYSKK